ncbi:hypothetical protein FS837_012418 [Tulasnella sp. UAMH 9824]|nr:hypothetical protein FS837_012418 [Tulasnella sp. UAMH 9824]
MKSLFSLRLVSKTWRDIVDGTPSFWVVLTSTVPVNVNLTTLTRSGGAPLIVHFGPSPIPAWNHLYDTSVQPDEFTDLVVPLRDRWKVVCVDGDAVPTVGKYLTSPAPMLETVRLHTTPVSGVPRVALQLLGGETLNIQQLYLHGPAILIHWDFCTLRGLKHLRLAYIDGHGLTTDVILDILAVSPELEHLSIKSMSFPVSTAPPLHPISLRHLRTIEFMFLPGNGMFSLLRHIEAPHCQGITIIGENVRNNNELTAHTNNEGPRKLPGLEVVAELGVGARPDPIKSLDFAIIAQIRAITGVKFILPGPWEVKDRAGICAVVWDDERGLPIWM